MTNGLTASAWTVSIADHAVRDLDRLTDPGLRDVLIGWIDPPTDGFATHQQLHQRPQRTPRPHASKAGSFRH